MRWPSFDGGYVLLLAALLLPGAATAAVELVVAPPPPTTVSVGGTYNGSLQIENRSSFPNESEGLAVTSIRMTPSCGTASGGTCGAGAEDPGVFEYGHIAFGRLAAEGIIFTVTVINEATGEVQFTPNSEFFMPPADGFLPVALIDFTFTVSKKPTIDAGPDPDGQPGTQTAIIGAVTAQGMQSGEVGGGNGASLITVIAELRVISVAKASNNVTILFTGEPGNTYQVQSKPALAPPTSWTNTGVPITADAQGNFSFSDTTSELNRFYHAIQ